MEKSNIWGEWTFSPEIQTKIDSLCLQLNEEKKESDPDDEAWHWLTNEVKHNTLLKKRLENPFVTDVPQSPVEHNRNEEPMEISLQSEEEVLVSFEELEETGNSSTVENSVILLLNALDSPERNKNSVTLAIKDISKTDLITIVTKVWQQLNTDSNRLCLCGILIENNQTSAILCQYILLPWLSEGKCTCIEAVAEILPHCADVACNTLILPLLGSKDSPFVTDIFALKDLTVHLQADHWCFILGEFIRSYENGLEKWHLPIIAVGIENSHNARRNVLNEVLNSLVVLMTCQVKDFAKDRDFGNIMIAFINCLSEDSSILIKQMTDVAQSYRGPLRYKAVNLLKSLHS